MGVELKGKIMSNYSKEVEWQQGTTTGIGFCVYIVLEYSCWLCYNDVVVRMSEFKSSLLGSLPWRSKYDLLLNVWYSESFVKEKQTPHFIFMVCPSSHSRASAGSLDVLQGQNHVKLLPGNEMSAGFHYRNWIYIRYLIF